MDSSLSSLRTFNMNLSRCSRDARGDAVSNQGELGAIHTKDARFFCCGNSDANISKSHTFKWGPLADEVLDASRSSPTEKNAECCGQVTRLN